MQIFFCVIKRALILNPFYLSQSSTWSIEIPQLRNETLAGDVRLMTIKIELKIVREAIVQFHIQTGP